MTAATLTALQAKIDAFDAVRTSPRDSIKQSAAATKRLPKLFGKMRVLLTKRLDPLIAPFKETNPELWSEYKTARKLVNLPTTEKVAKPNAKPDTAAEKSRSQTSSDKSPANTSADKTLKVVVRAPDSADKDVKATAKAGVPADKSKVV